MTGRISPYWWADACVRGAIAVPRESELIDRLLSQEIGPQYWLFSIYPCGASHPQNRPKRRLGTVVADATKTDSTAGVGVDGLHLSHSSKGGAGPHESRSFHALFQPVFHMGFGHARGSREFRAIGAASRPAPKWKSREMVFASERRTIIADQ